MTTTTTRQRASYGATDLLKIVGSFGGGVERTDIPTRARDLSYAITMREGRGPTLTQVRAVLALVAETDRVFRANDLRTTVAEHIAGTLADITYESHPLTFGQHSYASVFLRESAPAILGGA